MAINKVAFPERLKRAHYAIREIGAKAEELERKGRKIIYLNAGDPLRHGYTIPEELKEAMCEAVKVSNRYGNPIGELSTRRAIAEREKKINGIEIDEDHIVVGNGISEVFLLLAATIIDEGRELLVPGPTYPIYKTYVEFLGGKAVEYNCIEDEDWKPDLEDIRKKITDRTLGIVIINPNNPTGAVYSESTLKGIVDVAAEHGIMVLSDEIYDENIIEGDFKSVASLTDYPVIGFNGISKSLFATGWRFGYCYFHMPDEESIEVLKNLKKIAIMRSYTNMPVQKAVERILGNVHLSKKVMGQIKENRDYVWKRLNEITGLSAKKPKGAFYIFPKIEFNVNDESFVYGLLEKEGVAFVHGSGFGNAGKGHFRAVFLGKKEELEEAMDKLERFCKGF